MYVCGHTHTYKGNKSGGKLVPKKGGSTFPELSTERLMSLLVQTIPSEWEHEGNGLLLPHIKNLLSRELNRGELPTRKSPAFFIRQHSPEECLFHSHRYECYCFLSGKHETGDTSPESVHRDGYSPESDRTYQEAPSTLNLHRYECFSPPSPRPQAPSASGPECQID